MSYSIFQTVGDESTTRPLGMWLLVNFIALCDWIVRNPMHDYREWRDLRRLRRDLEATRHR
jgi:hypothetical protein